MIMYFTGFSFSRCLSPETSEPPTRSGRVRRKSFPANYGGGMRVHSLGPLEVPADGERVPVGGARLRTLLPRLALDAGRTVTTETLAETLWPEGPPGDPANALQSLVSRLRRALPAGRLVSAGGGYR